ncbi:ester cyclase [Alteribacillus sp. YIM 98480]|uniref:ester cyclase n=1 Tax=Alteribacillus sp. YIM 98480 TaxID=2606599 RepID=UPI00131D0F2C|nr:ester cyclase [Alteribacillus sp. YIM 98480]
MKDAKREVIRRFYEEIHNDDDLSKKDEILSSNYLVHEYDQDRNELVVEELHKAFPDIHYNVTHVVIDGEMAAVNWVAKGTHKGTFSYIPVSPTNKQITIKGAHFLRFADDKIEEVSLHTDRLGLAQQLGVAPAN